MIAPISVYLHYLSAQPKVIRLDGFFIEIFICLVEVVAKRVQATLTKKRP